MWISYMKKLQALGLISTNNNACLNKCKICIETKSTKKIYVSLETETKQLKFNPYWPCWSKQTMITGGKKNICDINWWLL